MGPLEEAWRRNHKICLRLVNAIPAGDFDCRYSDRTRTVGSQFAHLHYVRVKNLKERFPPHLGSLEAFERGAEPRKTEVKRALTASGNAMRKVFRDLDAGNPVRSWSGPPSTYLSYFVAHEEHHRALAILSLRLSGRKLPADLLHGLWYSWRKPDR